jgi:hypothetical protein
MTSTATKPAGSRAAIRARTLRTDRWWLPPLLTIAFLSVAGGYLTVRIFIPDYYFVEQYHYLTPVFSPCISEACEPAARDFGVLLPKLPALIPLPLLVFPILLGFRATCYYYRKAYYRSFWLSPPACAVAEPHRRYSGETRFPLIVQNFHRYFLYLASLLLLVNTYDAVHAFFPDGWSLTNGFGFGIGSLILLTNVALLWGYTLSCHACRHVAGGRLKHFSKHPLRYRLWTFISKLNARHMQFAWASLASVALTDLYILAVAAGWIGDLRFVN